MAGAPSLSGLPSAYGRLYQTLSRRWWLALLLMGASFVLFGLSTLNLLHLLSANVNFLVMNGIDAVRDGGLWQLISLIGLGYFAAVCYVVFKLCERVLVDKLTYEKTRNPEL